MIAFHRQRNALATIALYNPTNLDYYSRLEIDDTKKLRRMRLLAHRNPLRYDDYPSALDDAIATTLTSMMYCGVIVAEPAVLELIPPKTPWSLMPGLFAPMVADAKPVFGYVHTGSFRTIDDLKSYDAMKENFR
jgi:NDP-sugar pyrophosphorylase family protein